MVGQRHRPTVFALVEHLESRVLLDSSSWFDDLSNIDFSVPDTSQIDTGPAPASDNSGSYDYSTADESDLVPVTPPVFPPDRPWNLSAQPLSNTSIQLSWSQFGNDVNGFDIIRHGPRGSRVIATVPPYARDFVDQDLLPGTKYTYVVTAFNNDGEASADTSAGTLGDHLTMVRQPPSITAGSTFGFTVDLRDANNRKDTSADSPLEVAIASGPAGATLSGDMTALPAAGMATFSGLSLTVAGTYRLTITDGSATVLTRSFTVSADAASAHLVLLSQPPAVVGKGLGVRVGVEDAFGNLVTGNRSIVTLDFVSGPGELRGNLHAQVKKGVANFTSATVTVAGTYALSVQDAQLAGDSIQISQTVNPATSTISTPHVNSAGYTYGKPLTLSTTLHSSSKVAFAGSAMVVATDGTVLATAAVAENGTAHFTLNLTTGTYTATLQYAGDTNHTAAISRAFTFKIKPAPTTLHVQAAATPLTAGAAHALTVFVAGAGATPTGTISFFDGKTLLATVSLGEAAWASFTLPSLSVGTHRITAVYSGDPLHKTARSKLLRVTMTRLLLPASGAAHE